MTRLALRRRLLSCVMRVADKVRRRYWRFRGKTIYGVMAKAYTPDGALLLLRQTYSSGWHLPGGGRLARETPVEAALRELKEEVGLKSWRDARWQCSVDGLLSGVPAVVDVVEVRDVIHLFRPSLEVEQVALFDPSRLPQDLNPWTRHILMEAARLDSPADQ